MALTKAEWAQKIKDSIRKASENGVRVETLSQFGYWIHFKDGTKKRVAGCSKLLAALDPYMK